MDDYDGYGANLTLQMIPSKLVLMHFISSARKGEKMSKCGAKARERTEDKGYTCETFPLGLISQFSA